MGQPSSLPWTKVAEPRRKSGGGVVRVVEARVAALASPRQVLLQGQETSLVVVAETIPETGLCQSVIGKGKRQKSKELASIDRSIVQACHNKSCAVRKLVSDLDCLESSEIPPFRYGERHSEPGIMRDLTRNFGTPRPSARNDCSSIRRRKSLHRISAKHQRTEGLRISENQFLSG